MRFLLHRMRRERRLVTAISSSSFTVGGGASFSATDNVTQLTALCLSASFCFLVCVTPSMVLLIGKPYWDRPDNHWYYIAKAVTNQVYDNYDNYCPSFVTKSRLSKVLRLLGCSSPVINCCTCSAFNNDMIMLNDLR